MDLDYKTLMIRRNKLKKSKELPSSVNLRVHRALSWMEAADKAESLDAKFIFLWIAFNAAYAQEIKEDDQSGTLGDVHEFISTLVLLDKEELLLERVFCHLSGQIMPLIQNKYTSFHFWEFQKGKSKKEDAEKKFDGAVQTVQRAIFNKNPGPVIQILFQSCYTVRNQLVHGGATWEGKVNRAAVGGCTKILETVLPVFIHLILENPGEEWGDPCFPLVDDKESWMKI